MHHLSTVRIPLEHLTCAASDAPIIEHELRRLRGVVRAYVNPATETAYVDYDIAETDAGALAIAIADAGYRVGRPEPG